jgi:exodeoxyribonuclease VII large subunit
VSILRGLAEAEPRLRLSLARYLQREAQQVDHMAARIGRPTLAMGRQRAQLDSLQQAMSHALHTDLQKSKNSLAVKGQSLPRTMHRVLLHQQELCARAELRLRALDPVLVLQRGYAWLTQEGGHPVTKASQVQVGQTLVATLADGAVDLQVQGVRAN